MSSARGLAASGLIALSLLICAPILATAGTDFDQELARADSVRTSNQAELVALLDELNRQSESLSPTQLEYLSYLQAWKLAYDGQYESSLTRLRKITTEPIDRTVSFRATATLINVLVLSEKFEDAFAHLDRLLSELPQILDRDARDQGIGVAAYLYNQVGEYELGERYARMMVTEGGNSRGSCGGGQLLMEALYRSGRTRAVMSDWQSVVDHCSRLGELAYANFVRSYVIRIHIDQNRYEEAMHLLQDSYDEVQATQYPRLIAEFDSLLATAYRETGNSDMAVHYATRAIEAGVKYQYTEPLVQAYRLLYVVAKERGETAAALAYHEKFAAADKGFLDDISVRQIAYERVKHESIANKVQIDSLNSENKVLQLQRENNRLYIALLLSILGFIIFFAYRTKRSQLHFMKLSRQDGLTEIANRPHFLELADRALESSRRSRQEVCVVLCDLDYFKAINDQYGHAAGDAVLREVAATCRAYLRSNDVFGRVGGEEFGVLLPGCSLEAARERCEQLRLALAGLVVQHQDQPIGLTGSFGIETTASCGYDLRQLMANADAALYYAKDTGRNRVVAYDLSLGNVFGSAIQTGRLRARERDTSRDFAAQTE